MLVDLAFYLVSVLIAVLGHLLLFNGCRDSHATEALSKNCHNFEELSVRGFITELASGCPHNQVSRPL